MATKKKITPKKKTTTKKKVVKKLAGTPIDILETVNKENVTITARKITNGYVVRKEYWDKKQKTYVTDETFQDTKPKFTVS